VGLRRGRIADALAHATVARGLAARASDPAAEPRWLETMCALDLQRGALPEAEKWCVAAVELWRERFGSDDARARGSLAAAALVDLAQGDVAAAERELAADVA